MAAARAVRAVACERRAAAALALFGRREDP